MEIPNEKKRWEELRQLKSMPINMKAKKELKAQLAHIPMVKLKGWKRFRWHQQRFAEALKTMWVHNRLRRNFVFWQRSLQDIEIRCGTSIVNVFLFIKWTVFQNLWIFTMVAIFVVLPMIIGGRVPQRIPAEKCPAGFNESRPTHAPGLAWNKNRNTMIRQLSDCCTDSYYNDSESDRFDDFWIAFVHIFRSSKGIYYSPFVFGFYHTRVIKTASTTYNFALAYVLLPGIVFIISLIIMVRQIGTGIKEMILAREGEFYKYSNLVFSGWDHYTKDEASAKFKKKILKHEMKIALKTEKLKIETIQRTRRQKWKLFGRRVLANFLVLGIQVLVGAVIFQVAELSIEAMELRKSGQSTTTGEAVRRLGMQLLPSTCIAVFNVVFPIILRHIGRLEKYSTEAQMTWNLIRTLFVRLLSLAFVAYKFYSAFYSCSKRDGTCHFCSDGKPKSKCWESDLGVQLYLLVLMDFTIKVFMTFVIGVSRSLIAKYIPLKICRKMGNMKFNIARHSLDIVYIQCLAWFFYFAPFLPLLTAIYCILVFYVKKFAVLVNCKSVPDTYRTTRTTTIFVVAKLISFAVVSFAVGIVLHSLHPSRGCGPFRELSAPWDAVRILYSGSSPNAVLAAQIVNVLVSPGVTTPIAIILFLLGYYYYSIAQANKNMVETLRHLLVLEGHDKQYLFARLNTLRRQSAGSVLGGRTESASTAASRGG